MGARRHRRFANKDAIHDDVLKAYDRFGVRYRDLSHVGEGISDLLVQHHQTRELMLVELKSGDEKRDALTPKQEEFRKLWPVKIACSVDEALAVVGIVIDQGRRR